MRLLQPARQATYERVFGTVYVGLMTNMLLAITCAPLLAALALVRDPLASWPFFGVLSLLCAPALAGAFRCFAAFGAGSTSVAPAFWAGYRQAAGRALTVWAVAAVAVAVLVVDAIVVAGTSWGPALVPFFATAVALVVAVAVALLVAVAESPRRLRELLRPCLWLVARRWYLATLNVVVLALAVAVILSQPVLGILLACAPLLYVVWATTRYIVAPVLDV